MISRILLLFALLLSCSPAYAIPVGGCPGGQCQYAKPVRKAAALPPAAYRVKYKGVCSQNGSCARPRIVGRILRR